MNNEVLDNLDFQLEEKREKMKTIKLKRIELTNFKGIAHRIEEFADGENFIYGANGTGKTSVFDAFTWLLFGKDSQGQAEEKAKIKMMNSEGLPVLHTDNVVEGVFDVDGEELVLKRTYKEKWRKPTGQSESIYDGQKTEYSWNGNEKIGATEYKKRVSELIDEKLFKLITDPLFFPSLDSKERRSIVLGMAGEVSDDVIRASNTELKDFYLKCNVEETRSIAVSTKNRLVKDRDNYPARIDEQMQTITRKEQELKDLDLPDKALLQSNKADAENGLKEIEHQMSDVSARISEITKQNEDRLKKLAEIEEYKNYQQRKSDSEISKVNDNNHMLIMKKDNIKSEIASLDFRISKANQEIDNTNNELNEIKSQIKALSEQEVPDFDVIETCPTCGKQFDESEINTKKEEMRGNWIENQNKKINKLKENGNSIFSKGKIFKTTMEELEKQKAEKQKELEEIVGQIKDDIPYVKVVFDNDAHYKELLESVPKEVSVSESISIQNKELETKKAYFKGLIDGFNHQLNEFVKYDILKNDIETAKQRIENLKKEQMEVNQGIANQEKVIYLCDLYMKTKIELLNQFASSKFDLVKFKMYSYTKEGNAVPTCEIMVDGVDYTALNTASKINAGLDIINALINYYGMKAPIFIDNRESVTDIYAPDTQVINLVVMEGER